MARTLCAGQDAGEVLDAPRWFLSRDDSTGFNLWDLDEPPIVCLEHDAPRAWADGLQRRGYQVSRSAPEDQRFGHAQMIRVGADDLLCGAAGPRSGDGAFIAQ